MHGKITLKLIIVFWAFVLFSSVFLIQILKNFENIQNKSISTLRSNDKPFSSLAESQLIAQGSFNSSIHSAFAPSIPLQYISTHNIANTYANTTDGLTPYELLLYQVIALTATNIAFLIINIWYFLKFRRRDKEFKLLSNKAETIRKLIEEAVWFWGHGPQVLKNFDNLVAKGATTITLETLTRTWTQHYKKQFQKISHLSEAEALERAENQKRQDVVDLYNLLKDRIDVKVVPITFGKYAGSDSYQFEISESIADNQK